MGFISSSGGLQDFNKAVISFWFRVPQASVDAAADLYGSLDNSVVPLITFGRQQYISNYTTNTSDVAVLVEDDSFDHEGFTVPVLGYPEGPTVESRSPLPPSFIGLYCLPPRVAPTKPVTLQINLQMDRRGAFSHSYYVATAAQQYYDLPTAPFPHDGAGNPDEGCGWVLTGALGLVQHTDILDISYADSPQPEVYTINCTPEITPGQWHHVLISFDLSSGAASHTIVGGADVTNDTTDAYSRLWYAIDDVNYAGTDNLRPFPVDGSDDPNAILTDAGWHFARRQTLLPYNTTVPDGTYSFNGFIPAENGPMSIPANPSDAAQGLHIFQVEMAEMQIYAGVSLDTGDVNNRRLFITETGKPVDAKMGDFGSQKDYSVNLINDALGAAKQAGVPLDLTATAADVSAKVNVFGTTHPEAKPAKFFGQPPDVLLHGSRHWIMGQSTGAAELNFSPTGTIKAFKPDPKVGD